jgi:hypothetical protein
LAAWDADFGASQKQANSGINSGAESGFERNWSDGPLGSFDMKQPIFTAHNIRLDDNRTTKPDHGATMEAYPWFVSARNVINLVFPGEKNAIKIVDLGCLEGGYTVEFARMGLESLGIEIRNSNIECCKFVKDNVDLPNLRFVQDNVINISKYGDFDIAFCCGLLYHLDKPRAFLEQLAKQTRRMMILQTHFSLGHAGSQRFNLSPLVENEGLAGRWFGEFEQNISNEQLDLARWSSYHNNASFWIRREYLIDLIYKLGFDTVFEQFDSLKPEIAKNLINEYEGFLRGTFVGIRNI